ncbi:MAG: DoxX family protein, partial [Opitutaceae bacterium]
MKFLHLNFLPRSADTALLLLRVWHGASLLLLHGWGKVTGFSSMSDTFPDPFGFGPTPSLVLAIMGEAVCSSLLVLGLFTRVAAFGSGATMATAFWFAHQGKLTGDANGELAFVYLGVFLALFIAGAGKFSL